MDKMYSTIRQIRSIQELKESTKNNNNSKMAPVKVDLTPVVDNYQTASSELQHETEASILPFFEGASEEDYKLKKEKHGKFLKTMLGELPMQFKSLDASRPWMIYWGVNALMLLGMDVEDLKKYIGDTILACQSPDGGLGGGNGQLSHLAPTYAGITALALCGDAKKWDQIDRKKMYKYLMDMKQDDGSFTMHRNGEVDTRACYCALAVASLLNIVTDELVADTVEFIQSCQTYEGGFSAIPGTEAHGGYAFCALGALCIIGPPTETITKLDTVSLLRWLSVRQSQPEKGFSGRTNKLVDGCYNHWVGGCWALLEAALQSNDSLWDRRGLANYTLLCCQAENGGLRDKPSKRPDAYHSNYTLCGLSGAQYRYFYNAVDKIETSDYAFNWGYEKCDLGLAEESDVLAINPVHVLPMGVAEKMHDHYKQVDKIK